MPEATDPIPVTPTCTACLHPMEPAGSDQRPYWQCPHCDATAISA